MIVGRLLVITPLDQHRPQTVLGQHVAERLIRDRREGVARYADVAQPALHGTIALDQTVTTTSADGMTVDVATDLDGDGVVDENTVGTTVINPDGSVTDATVVNYADGTQRSSNTVTTSADGRTTTSMRDEDLPCRSSS